MSMSEFTNSGEGYTAIIFIFGAYAAPNPALTFFFFFAKKRKRMSAKKKKHANLQRCKATQDQMDVVKC